jgi:putative transposase
VASPIGPAETTVLEPGAGDRAHTAVEPPASVIDDDTIAVLAAEARSSGLALMGEGGLTQQMFKRFLEASLEGRPPRLHPLRPGRACWRQLAQWPAGQNGDHRGRSGEPRRARNRDGSFEPVIVRKRQRRLAGGDGIDGLVLSLSAKGLTTREISAHLTEVSAE